jgi:hypothetical protein
MIGLWPGSTRYSSTSHTPITFRDPCIAMLTRFWAGIWILISLLGSMLKSCSKPHVCSREALLGCDKVQVLLLAEINEFTCGAVAWHGAAVLLLHPGCC